MATTITEHFGLSYRPELDKASAFVAGLECEIESIREPANYGIFTVKQDHSLRNYGYEWISVPANLETLVGEFSDLHSKIVFRDQKTAFSERTSIHVHVNCRSLDLKQTRNVVLLYALFEEYFFRMCHPDRRNNIHCTPLTETHLPVRYPSPIPRLVESWSKYTALNLLPLASLGTIEFRHMHGHNNTGLLEQWLVLLKNLWYLGQEVEISSRTLGNNDTILKWFGDLFGHTEFVETTEQDVFQTISNSLLDLKLAV